MFPSMTDWFLQLDRQPINDVLEPYIFAFGHESRNPGDVVRTSHTYTVSDDSRGVHLGAIDMVISASGLGEPSLFTGKYDDDIAEFLWRAGTKVLFPRHIFFSD